MTSTNSTTTNADSHLIIGDTGWGINITSKIMAFFFAFLLLLVPFANLIVGIFAICGAIGLIGLAFQRTGTVIDLNTEQYQQYFTFIWLRRGKWKSLKKYPYVTFTTDKIGLKAQSAHGIEATSTYEKFYSIYLLSANYRSKVLVVQLRNKEKVKVKLKYLLDHSNFVYKSLNPQKNPDLQSMRQQRRR